MDDNKISTDIIGSISADTAEYPRMLLNVSEVPNQLSGRFEINIGIPLQDKSTDFAEAYAVTDNADNNADANKFYALVFRKNLPSRIPDVIAFKELNSKCVVSPVDYGIVPIGSGADERFVTIVPRVKAKSINEILKAGIQLDRNFVINKFIPGVLSALHLFHQTNIYYGKLNLDNILLDENGDIILKECISDLSGYSQIPLYETIDRAQCNPISKGYGDKTIDYYAFGMSIYVLLSGKNFAHLETSEMLREKLYQGTYHFLNAAYTLDGITGDIIRGLTVDEEEIRWGKTEVDDVLNGKQYNQAVTNKSYLTRAIVFNGREHYSKKSLAYDLYLNWDEAKEFIKLDKIRKWLDTTLTEELTIEALDTLINVSLTKNPVANILSNADENLCKTILILDPTGPIRLKNVVFKKGGFGPLLAHSIATSKTPITQLLAAILFINVVSIFDVLAEKLSAPALRENVSKLLRCNEYIKKSEFGFGIERCLYELNSTLPCQSHLFAKKFCIALGDCLEILNQTSIRFEDIVSKKNLSSFIATKINLVKEIRNKELEKYPIVQRSRAYQILGIFSLAQKQTRSLNLIPLCEVIQESVKDVLDIALKSLTLKKKFFEKLAIAAKTGNFQELQKIALASNYINDDAEGYAHAIQRGAEIAKEIFSYNNKAVINIEVRKKSLNLAIKITYSICGLIILLMVLRNF